MEDTNNHIMTKSVPGILDIKPVEELQGVQKVEEKEQDLPEIEDATPKDIFIRPASKPVKKKKQLSERQRAHLQRLREMKVIKKQEREKKKAEQLKKESMNNIKKPLPEPAPEIQKPQLQRQPTATTVPQPNKLSNQQYMSEFFSNMNMFIEAANKYTDLKTAKTKSPPITPPEQRKPKAVPKAVKQQEPNHDDSYYVDFLKPQVGYDYKNPFGF